MLYYIKIIMLFDKTGKLPTEVLSINAKLWIIFVCLTTQNVGYFLFNDTLF